jgi:rhodanese-related sulfurtransferase
MKSLKLILLFSLVSFLFSSSQMMAPAKKISSQVKDMNTLESFSFLHSKMNKKNLSILDVRTAKEYVSGHIAGALNLDFFARDFRSQLEKLDRGKSYLIICHSGGRSAQTVKIMEKNGFKHLFHAKEGMSHWLLAKYPLQRGQQPGKRSDLSTKNERLEK